MRTFRPLGPSVVATALAKVSIPLSNDCRASTPNLSSYRRNQYTTRFNVGSFYTDLVCEAKLLTANNARAEGIKSRNSCGRTKSAVHIDCDVKLWERRDHANCSEEICFLDDETKQKIHTRTSQRLCRDNSNVIYPSVPLV